MFVSVTLKLEAAYIDASTRVLQLCPAPEFQSSKLAAIVNVKKHVASHSNISFGPSPCFLHTRPLCVACK